VAGAVTGTGWYQRLIGFFREAGKRAGLALGGATLIALALVFITVDAIF
jgi:hypothetical protein